MYKKIQRIQTIGGGVTQLDVLKIGVGIKGFQIHQNCVEKCACTFPASAKKKLETD